MSETTITRRLSLYFVRHGETEAGDRLAGQTDVDLSDRGLAQARKLAAELSDVGFDAIYSSDLARARLMAEIIAENRQLEVRASSAWREIDMGLLEGRSLKSVHAEDPELVRDLFGDPALFTYP